MIMDFEDIIIDRMTISYQLREANNNKHRGIKKFRLFQDHGRLTNLAPVPESTSDPAAPLGQTGKSAVSRQTSSLYSNASNSLDVLGDVSDSESFADYLSFYEESWTQFSAEQRGKDCQNKTAAAWSEKLPTSLGSLAKLSSTDLTSLKDAIPGLGPMLAKISVLLSSIQGPLANLFSRWYENAVALMGVGYSMTDFLFKSY